MAISRLFSSATAITSCTDKYKFPPRTSDSSRGVFARPAAVAGRVPLPDMRRAGSLGHGAGLASLPRVRSADLGDGRDLVRGHAFALACVVRSALARDQPEERGQRPGPAAGVGAGELSHRVEFAAQAAPGDGSTWTD